MDRAALSLTLGVFLTAACSAPERAPSLANEGRAEAAAPAALGEARSATLPLRVRVVEARRVSPGAVEIGLEVLHTGEAAVPGPLDASLGGLAGLSLLTADRRRRLFPLSPVGAPDGLTIAPPPPGGSSSLRVAFAVDPDENGALTLLLPGFGAISGIQAR